MHSDRCKNLAIISDISFFIPDTDFYIWHNVTKAFMKLHLKLYGTKDEIFRKYLLNLRGSIEVLKKSWNIQMHLCVWYIVHDLKSIG